jgi:hypothetical protein
MEEITTKFYLTDKIPTEIKFKGRNYNKKEDFLYRICHL